MPFRGGGGGLFVLYYLSTHGAVRLKGLCDYYIAQPTVSHTSAITQEMSIGAMEILREQAKAVPASFLFLKGYNVSFAQCMLSNHDL